MGLLTYRWRGESEGKDVSVPVTQRGAEQLVRDSMVSGARVGADEGEGCRMVVQKGSEEFVGAGVVLNVEMAHNTPCSTRESM